MCIRYMDKSLFGVRPVQSLSAGNDLYMVMAGCGSPGTSGPCSTTTSVVEEFRVTGLPPNVGEVMTSLTMSALNAPPAASEPGGGTVWSGTACGSGLATAPCNDQRVQTAAWFNGKLWFALNDGCGGSGNAFDCIRLAEIDTQALVINQNWDLSLVGPNGAVENMFYPAVTIDGMGNMILVYGFSDANDFPSIAVTEQAFTDAATSTEPSPTLVAGTQIANSTRYGDYFGAAVDPANTTNVWISGEYMSVNRGKCSTTGTSNFNCWSTRIGAVSTTTFSGTGDSSSLNIQRGTSIVSNVTLTSLNGFHGPISLSGQTSISITTNALDDSSSRQFGLAVDQTLNPTFWITQPTPVSYTHLTLPTI